MGFIFINSHFHLIMLIIFSIISTLFSASLTMSMSFVEAEVNYAKNYLVWLLSTCTRHVGSKNNDLCTGIQSQLWCAKNMCIFPQYESLLKM